VPASLSRGLRMNANDLEHVPWKRYILAVFEAVITFTIATFLLGLYIIHRGDSSLFLTIFIAIFFAATVIVSIYRMVRKFSLAANMLMVPIAPLVILGIIVSMIHLLQYFK